MKRNEPEYPIRVLHFADTHIGVTTHSDTEAGGALPSRVQDQLNRLDDIQSIADKQEPDLIVFAGDLFDSPTPSNALRRIVAERCIELANIAELIIIPGNHDTMRRAAGSPLDMYPLFDHPRLWIADQYGVSLRESPKGKYLIGTAPYPREWTLTPGIKGTRAHRLETLTAAVHSTLHEMDALADKVEVFRFPRLLLGHFSVTDAYWSGGGEADPATEVIVDADWLADQDWDYVALGHIHRHQSVRRNIVYSGSTSRIGFNEEDEPKGVVMIELAPGEASWEFIPLEQARGMFTLTFECGDNENPTDAALDWLHEQVPFEGDILRYQVNVPLDRASEFHDGVIEDAARMLGASHIVIQKTARGAAEDENASSGGIEGLSHEALLEMHLEQKGMTPERRAELLSESEPFMSDR